MPATDEIYPPGDETRVDVGSVARPLEGQCRPGHFEGVATVVLKLFLLAQPDVAFFGRKDYQQSLVVRRLVKRFSLPIDVRVCPTIREARRPGPQLAQSLSDRRRAAAGAGLVAVAASGRASWCTKENLQPRAIEERMRSELTAAGLAIDYAVLADPETLAPIDGLDRPHGRVGGGPSRHDPTDRQRADDADKRSRTTDSADVPNAVHIPAKILGIDVFGFGWLLGVWAVVSVVMLAWLVSRHGFGPETRSHLPGLALAGAGDRLFAAAAEPGRRIADSRLRRDAAAGDPVARSAWPPIGPSGWGSIPT